MRPVAIVGVGESRVGRLRGMSALRLTLEASRAAMQDAGVSASAIDGVLTRNLDMDVTYMHSQYVAKHLGIQPRFTTDVNLGGATAIAMLEQAAMLINTGVCNFVLCAYGENRRTSWAFERHGKIRMGCEDFEECYGLTWGMGPHALAAQRHMFEFGTTSRQLGMIAVAQRQFAVHHPNAEFREPLSLEDYEQSPFLIAPLRKYDLAYLFDGGAAVVVAPLDWARDHAAAPVSILGLGQAHSREAYRLLCGHGGDHHHAGPASRAAGLSCSPNEPSGYRRRLVIRRHYLRCVGANRRFRLLSQRGRRPVR